MKYMYLILSLSICTSLFAQQPPTHWLTGHFNDVNQEEVDMELWSQFVRDKEIIRNYSLILRKGEVYRNKFGKWIGSGKLVRFNGVVYPPSNLGGSTVLEAPTSVSVFLISNDKIVSISKVMLNNRDSDYPGIFQDYQRFVEAFGLYDPFDQNGTMLNPKFIMHNVGKTAQVNFTPDRILRLDMKY